MIKMIETGQSNQTLDIATLSQKSATLTSRPRLALKHVHRSYKIGKPFYYLTVFYGEV